MNKSQKNTLKIALVSLVLLSSMFAFYYYFLGGMTASIYTSSNLDFLKQKCADTALGGLGVIYMSHPTLSSYCLMTTLNNPEGNVCEAEGYTNPVTCSSTSTIQTCSQQNGFLSVTSSCSTLDTSTTTYTSVTYANSQLGTLCCVGSPKTQCTDTDSGYDLNHKGTITFGSSVLTDSCSGNLLNEYVCYGIVESNGEVTQDQNRRNTYTIIQKNCSSFINGICLDGICTTQSLSCTPNWVCTGYGDCLNNIKTRTCQDQNNCPIPVNKPVTTEVCNPTQCNTLVGQLCNPTTKSVANYNTDCEQTTLTSQGYSSTDLSLCQTSSPPACETGSTKKCTINNVEGSQTCVGGSWSQCTTQLTVWDKIKEWFSDTTNQVITAVVGVLSVLGIVLYFTQSKGRK